MKPTTARRLRSDLSAARATMAAMSKQIDLANERARFARYMRAVSEDVVLRPRETSSDVREMTAVALASDWHVEERVNPAAVAGINAYNLQIAAARVRRFFESIAWNIQHDRASGKLAIRDLVLWLGGDLISGYIHEELMESNFLSPTMAVRWLFPRLRDGIRWLLDTLALETIVIPCSYGNHGRTTAKRRVATGFENSYEALMYCMLADLFEGEPRVKFIVTPSAHQYVQVYDYTLHFHHGDEVKFNGGIGGIAPPLLRRVARWDRVRKTDVHHIGHFHQYTDFGRVVVNGSLIGYGPFSMSIGADPEPPQQAFYYVDSKRGKCKSTPLWVSK